MSTTTTDFSIEDFRKAAGQFATGITVVSVRDGAHLRGMTANSFTSVSLEPALVLVSVDTRRSIHQPLVSATQYVISILSDTQQHISGRFASTKTDMRTAYDDIPHDMTPEGLPLIHGALAHFVCRPYAVYPGGDHSLFVGQVETLQINPGTPLLYAAGGYQTLRATT